MSGAIVATVAAAAIGAYSAHQQSKAQKSAAKTQREAQDRANQLQAEANNTAEQQNNKAAKATARNYDAADTTGSTGITNANGALGYGSGSYNLGSNNKLGASSSDDSIV